MAPGKVSNFVFRVEAGMARMVIGRKSAKIFAKVFIGEKGVEILNKLYDACRILVGGDEVVGNEFIDLCLRILTDFAMYFLQSKFREEESERLLTLVNQQISVYNDQFELLERLSPGFNAVEIPSTETDFQKLFKLTSSKFIHDVTSILIDTLGHHFQPGLIRSIRKVAGTLCQGRVLDQMCYGKSPATLKLEEVLESIRSSPQLMILVEGSLESQRSIPVPRVTEIKQDPPHNHPRNPKFPPSVNPN